MTTTGALKKNIVSAKNEIQNDMTCDVIDWLSKTRHGNVHKWIFSTPETPDDPVRGSQLWDSLYRAPDYYLPRYEIDVINKFSENVNQSPFLEKLFGNIQTVYDLGPGSGDSVVKKSGPILKFLKPGTEYCPVDVSESFVESAVVAAHKNFPDLRCRPCIEDFENPHPYKSENGLILFFGSTMFNVPCGLTDGLPETELTKQLEAFKNFIGSGYLVVTQDTANDGSLLRRAYDSPEHAAMTENFAARIARDLTPGGTFDPAAWRYKPIWRPENFQFAHALEAVRPQNFSIDGKSFSINTGDYFITHNSFKLPGDVFTGIVQKAGFRPVASAANKYFVLHVLRLGPYLE